MTDLEMVKKIINQYGSCDGIICAKCPIRSKCYHPFDWYSKLQIAKDYVKEHEMKFKVGDKVKIKSSYVERDGSVMLIDKAIFTIEKISGEHIYLQGVDYPYFTADDLEKPEKLEVTTSYKDPKWCMVRDSEDEEWVKAILINDNSDLNLEYPYLVVEESSEKWFLNGENGYTGFYRYVKPCPEYEAYSEPKLEWIGKIVKGKNNDMLKRIRYISDSGVVFSGDGGSETPFDYLYKNYTWLDGSVCGEEK